LLLSGKAIIFFYWAEGLNQRLLIENLSSRGKFLGDWSTLGACLFTQILYMHI
jgi:hypothetical protein